MADYKVNFKDLKSRVGIDDIAYALGYRLDRKAGVGKYIELVLGDGTNRRDTIIVSNPRDKAAQTFFRRDGSKGDVVTLIRENLDSFFVTGKDEWQKIAKVMARFANMPEPEYKEDREYVKSASVSHTFDSSRYEVKQVDPDRIPRYSSREVLPMKRSRLWLRSFPLSVTRETKTSTDITSASLIPRRLTPKFRVMKSVEWEAISRRLPAPTPLQRHGSPTYREETTVL